MKGVQCYEIFLGIALKNHAFSINQSLFSIQANNNNNIHTFANINTERAGNEVILLM